MSLVSYAQNFEDVMLWRALKHIEKGFYIDVGAAWPDEHSVTKAFYENGWRGINIEPNSAFNQALCSQRPRDINLRVAVGAADGTLTMHLIQGTGLSTLDSAVAKKQEAAGWNSNREDVIVKTLASIWQDNVPEQQQVHFLKVDVEGFEEPALKGNDWGKNRPWIVVVEATLPLSQQESFHAWESILLDASYVFAYADGLNRFYVASEHAELMPAFRYPPNVFDGFVLSSQQKAEAKAHHAEAKALETLAKLDSVYSSRSWRITAPLRSMNAVRRNIATSLKTQVKDTLRKAVVRATALITRHPGLKQTAARVLRRFPKLDYRLRSALQAGRMMRRIDAPVIIAELADQGERFIQHEDDIAIPQPPGRRIVYLYVEHTAKCATHTGVQQVTRGIAAGLIARGERVRFVKWHAESQRCLLLNATEREHLARWNGPNVTAEERTLYPAADKPQIAVEPSGHGANHWLVVPEVTHITYQPQAVTLDLLMWSRRSGLKAGFVFYDAIPLRRPEFQTLAADHALYMQQLLLADAVWPISDWAKADLQAFWLAHEFADANSMPEVKTQALSGESLRRERVLHASAGTQLILSVGTIEPRKNQLQLIKAFQSYCASHPETRWRLALVGNLHTAVANEVSQLVKRSDNIKHLGHVSEKELDKLYSECDFTVFPSIEEGFGLPILESLWYGKPCICANFGSMAEVAAEGGCLTVDTRDMLALESGITRLIEGQAMRAMLAEQATKRPIKSWNDYAAGISARIERDSRPALSLGIVYFWIDATLQFSKNTGIQRVARQLARSLIEAGCRLVPVKWNERAKSFGPVTAAELAFFEQWNGPPASAWESWITPETAPPGGWFLMPELPLNRSSADRSQLLKAARTCGLRCAAVFYDAIPWKLRRIYPAAFSQAHRAYMLELNDYDLVLPISSFSKDDLVDFLGAELPRPQSLSHKIKAVTLAGEFAESPRPENGPSDHDGPLRILCVGTVEPRKNHEVLLRAFALACEMTTIPLKLTVAGGSHSIEPALAERVRAFIASHPNVTWEEHADDARLRELHMESDFTVYPSVEEGFGLPILESLWYARPCICADFGAMYEVAEGGGCLMVDVRDTKLLANAIVQLATDQKLRGQLVQETLSRNFKSWSDYATEVTLRLLEATPKSRSRVAPLTPNEATKLAAAMRLQPRPLLSVCISTYNRAEWLSTSLRNWSRLYPEPLAGVELLVCDNTSTDNTPEVVRPYMDRPDFSYRRNQQNVGMLGNLRETAHHARGEYVWIIGDDDLLRPGSVEHVLDALNSHRGVALVYLNYAFTREEDARKVTDFNAFFSQAQPIVPAERDRHGPIRNICARNENFFSAIYTLVFRRDHALKAYSQDTSGRPFSSMPTCIPTTTYILGYMMDELGVWVGTPQLVVNLNVSWMRYAPLWILERVPEMYELAEHKGVPSTEMDRWRLHTLPGVVHYFQEIYRNDPLNNAAYFSPERLVRRFKHLPEFTKVLPVLKSAYARAYAEGHQHARRAPEKVFPEPSDT